MHLLILSTFEHNLLFLPEWEENLHLINEDKYS